MGALAHLLCRISRSSFNVRLFFTRYQCRMVRLDISLGSLGRLSPASASSSNPKRCWCETMLCMIARRLPRERVILRYFTLLVTCLYACVVS